VATHHHNPVPSRESVAEWTWHPWKCRSKFPWRAVNQSHLQDCVRLASGPRIASVATLALLLAGAASAARNPTQRLWHRRRTPSTLAWCWPFRRAGYGNVRRRGRDVHARRDPWGLAGLGARAPRGRRQPSTRRADLLRDKRGNPLAPVRPAPARSGAGLVRAARGLGGTLVYEDRTLVQGARAGLPASEQEITSWAMLPAADFEGIVVLRVWNSWGMSVSGGPTLHGLHGGVRTGWTSGLGVTLATLNNEVGYRRSCRPRLSWLWQAGRRQHFRPAARGRSFFRSRVTLRRCNGRTPSGKPALRVALVWGAQWLPEPFCVLPPPDVLPPPESPGSMRWLRQAVPTASVSSTNRPARC